MNAFIILLFVLCCIGCSTTRYYVVRHAEKKSTTTMTTDVPLSEEGKQRATALKELLLPKKITHIFSTNYKRTMATAHPLAAASGVNIHSYKAMDTLFVERLKRITAGNVLVVGHSNTVDDLVNGLTGKKYFDDLPDSRYGDLFIITKRGKRYYYSKSRFGL